MNSVNLKGTWIKYSLSVMLHKNLGYFVINSVQE